MKTTIDIPDKELEEVMRLTGAKTKKEAVVTAIVYLIVADAAINIIFQQINF